MTILIAQIIFIGSAVALSILILLQQSKGASMGASFGSGASGTVFGSRGSGSFLYKFTRALALVFFISALTMGYVQNKSADGLSGSIYSAQNQSQTEKTAAGVDVPTSGKDNSAPASDTSIPLSGNK